MAEPLRRTRDVRAALSRGWAVHGAHAVLRARARNDEHGARWTVSASRRVGSAVRRNRAKRRLRAVMRETALPEGVDLVVIARASAVTCRYRELAADVEELVESIRGRERSGVSR